ncbi:hypothetical protein FGO68_gene9267 [Halteria grandinella]|uniref:Uncharacterized protein n=1 Tax=Halteria grandinella TaxID=5974 RepID=A0A8J8NC71_HALGN|nr:hypothetical protein FGO68_gene9267 [Halteria grandinella]
MDLKALFHNPESLTDEELNQLKTKIALQRSVPWTTATFTGVAWYLFEASYLRKSACLKRAAVAGVLGFAIGAYSVNAGSSNSLPRLEGEAQIIEAFDRRYMNTVLNVTGFGSNYLSVRDYADTQVHKKPY